MAKAPDYVFQVKESHLDTFGHVNNAAYLELFEEARWELITGGGYGLKEVLEKRQGPVVLEVNLKFKKELKLRETIRVSTEVAPFSGKISHISQKMIKEDGEIAAEALFTFGFFDLNARKLIPPTEAWLKATGLAR